MANSENILNKAFELIEQAEQKILNYEYQYAMENLEQALGIFHQAEGLGLEKEQALAMIEIRIKDLEGRIKQSESPNLQSSQVSQASQISKTNQAPQSSQSSQTNPAFQTSQAFEEAEVAQGNVSIPLGLSPPPVFGEDREQLIKLGLKALSNSEQLMGQGYLFRAYKSILYAYSHLSRAQYNMTKVQNIEKVAQMMAERLHAMGYQLKKTDQEYTPSFLTTEQPNYLPTGTPRSNGSIKFSGIPENYQPTFLSTEQIDYTLSPSETQQSRRTNKNQPYIPTFAQTNQPDFTETSDTRIPYLQRSPQREQPYKPTFAQTDQSDYIPVSEKQIILGKSPSTSDQDFIPTFTQVSEAQLSSSDEANIDLSELQSMFAFIEKGEPIPETTKIKAKSESSRITHTDQAQSTLTPKSISTPFIHPKNETIVSQEFLEKKQLNLKTLTQKQFDDLYESKQHDLEIRAQEVLDKFEKVQEEQIKKKNNVLQFINLIHSQEKSYDYDGAIASLYKAINKMNKLLGWADQVLVLYAWMLILKEKKRTQFRHGGNPNDFDLMKINTEFVQIMTDSLNTSREVAISFIGDDFNQELTAGQIYKVKLEEQENLQNKVFELLDTANLKILNQQYTQAIKFYNRAVLALNSLDWAELRQNIEDLILEVSDLQQLQDLFFVKEINSLEVSRLFQYPTSLKITPEQYILAKAKELLESLDKISELRENRIAELAKIIKKQSEQKYRAFSLIIQAEGLVISDLYDESIEAYEEALTLLIEAGWAEQIPKIINRLVKIRQIREEFIHSKQKQYDQLFKRNIERRNFEDSIMHGITKELLEIQTEEHSEEEIKALKKELKEKKEAIFELLSQVEKKVENGQLAEAILQLKDVKTLLQKHHWDEHLSFIYDFVSMVQDEQTIQENNQKWKKKLQDESEQYKQEIQAYVDEQSAKISTLMKIKRKILQEYQTYKVQEINIAHESLSLLEQAQTHMQRNEYHMAIELFQEIELNFMKIGWNVDMQPCIYRAYSQEREFKKSSSKYEHANLLQREAELKSQYKQQKQGYQQQSALSDVQNLLATLHGKGGAATLSSEPNVQNTQSTQIKLNPPNKSIPSGTSSTFSITSPTSIESSQGKPSSLEELQRMIREAAEKDKKEADK
ncbi:MAG: hypothetical protein ACTSX0_14840 [Promethearchaeota archaeon]